MLVNLHSIDIARRYCRRVIGMRGGDIVFDGPVADLTDEAIAAIYGSQAPKRLADPISADAPPDPAPALRLATA